MRKEARTIITMACNECKSRNYTTTKKPRKKQQNEAGSGVERLELRKFCPRCRTHTQHREAK